MQATLGNLISVRSKLAEGIAAYYRSVIAKLDRTPWYRAGQIIPASAVAIPARVLKEVTEPESGFRLNPREEQEPDKRDELPRIDREVAALYEQRVLERRQEEVSWEAVSSALRRAVILGGPGGGKTFLTQTTALALAQQGLEHLEQRSKPPEDLPLPVWLEQDTLGQAEWSRDLGQALVAILREQYDVAAHLERWLIAVLPRSNCLLILDAMDQVRPGNLARLRKWLEALESWGCRVLQTCRTANYNRARIPWAEVTEYELALFSWAEMRDLIGRWHWANDRQGEQLKAVMERSYSLRHVCQTPLLATLACLANGGKALTAETSRGSLYAQVLRDLLRRAHRKDPLGSAEPHVDDLLEMLEAMAWQLFRTSPAVNQFGNAEVKAAIEIGVKEARLDEARHTATALRDELLADGVLVGAGLNCKTESQYSVLHRGFLEYLVAQYLGRVMETNGWEKAVVSVQGRPVPLRTLLDKSSWLAEWREVITLLAGRLEDAGPLIRLLKKKKSDDMFRHRLALAGRCLGDLRNPEPCRKLINEVTAAVWRCYWKHLKASTTATVEHLERTLPVLAELNGEIWPGHDILAQLTGLLATRDCSVRDCAAEALGRMGPVAARAEDVERLVGWLRGWDREEQAKAAWTLGQLGHAAARPGVVGELVALLGDPLSPSWVRSSVAGAVGRMGSTAWEKAVGVLFGSLRDPSAWVRCEATETLGLMWRATPCASVLHALVGLRNDPDWSVRKSAAEVLGQLGQTAACAEVVDTLGALLRDPNLDVRITAACALSLQGPTAAQAEVVDVLVKRLRKSDGSGRSRAADALGRLGKAAARADVVDALVALRRNPHLFVRISAARALGRMGPAAARAEVLGVLVEWLRDSDHFLRSDTARALGQLGQSAARTDVLDELAGVLRDPHPGVRIQAAWALGQLGQTVPPADVVDGLVGLLETEDELLRGATAKALGELGKAAERADVVAALVVRLQDPDPYVQTETAKALGQLGQAATRADVAAALVSLLRDRHWDVRFSAACTLAGMMRSGFRFFPSGTGRIREPLVVTTSKLTSLRDRHRPTRCRIG